MSEVRDCQKKVLRKRNKMTEISLRSGSMSEVRAASGASGAVGRANDVWGTCRLEFMYIPGGKWRRLRLRLPISACEWRRGRRKGRTGERRREGGRARERGRGRLRLCTVPMSGFRISLLEIKCPSVYHFGHVILEQKWGWCILYKILEFRKLQLNFVTS